MASQGLMSIVDPNHDGGNPCRICCHFSHFKQVGHLLPDKVHSTEALKTEIALHARQFSSNCQQDPVEYIEQILSQCTILQESSTYQSFNTYTCMTCKVKTHGTDVRNTLILPLRKEDENLSLFQDLGAL